MADVQPGIGADVSHLMPDVGEDVSHLMAPSGGTPPPDFVAHAELPTAEQLQAATTPKERVDILAKTPVGQDLQQVANLFRLWVLHGPHAVVQGIKDATAGLYTKGLHEVLTGAGLTALPFVAGPAVGAAIEAPLTAATVAAGAYGGQRGAQTLATAAGATPDQAALAGDVGGIGGGMLGGPVAQGVRSLPTRQVAQSALTGTAAVLDNPIAGMISPRARQVGQGAGRVADYLASRGPSPPATARTVSEALTAITAAAQEAGVQLKAADAIDLATAVSNGTPLQEAVAVIGELADAPVVRTIKRPILARPSVEPAPTPAPTLAAAPAPAITAPAGKSPQQILNEEAIAARRAALAQSPAPAPAAEPIVAASGKMRLTAPELQEFQRLLRRGLSLPDALTQVTAARDLAGRLGGASAAEVAATVAHRNAGTSWGPR